MNDVSKVTLKLLDLPATQLLDGFGSGAHVPGSGSAAALMGLLAAQLTRTVCRITAVGIGPRPGELDYLAKQMEERFIPRLQSMFQQDADIFDVVIKQRRRRDGATEDAEKRRWRERALRTLEEATELVMDIADLCLVLVEHAVTIFEHGAKKVRGDSGAAISAAIAGASTAVFIANLNLRSFQGSRWAQAMQQRINTLQAALVEKQAGAFAMAKSLQIIELEPDQLTLFGDAGDGSTPT